MSEDQWARGGAAHPFNRLALERRGIATKAEREALAKLNEKPLLRHTLEPRERTAFRMDYDARRWRERRMAYLQSRLSKAQVTLERDFHKAR